MPRRGPKQPHKPIVEYKYTIKDIAGLAGMTRNAPICPPSADGKENEWTPKGEPRTNWENQKQTGTHNRFIPWINCRIFVKATSIPFDVSCICSGTLAGNS
jgi:hypothetical protein